MIVTVPTRRLGDLTSSQLLGNTLTGSATSPFLYVGAGLLLWYLWNRGSDAVASIGSPKPRRRRRTRRIPALTAAVYAAGAGAGGYLLGKYTNV